MIDFHYLLEQYRSLWNNRTLHVEGSSEDTLKEAIERELRDENSHPRIRKNIYEKFFLAIKRINTSSLSKEDKLTLITIHIKVLEQIKNN